MLDDCLKPAIRLIPPRVCPSLKAAPRIRDMYWCQFPEDAQLPELWKKRPVIVLSPNNTLSGAVTVVPCTTQDQGNSKWAYKLQTSIDGTNSWAICDKPSTFAVSRLRIPSCGRLRVSEQEFVEILRRVLGWLPSLEKTLEKMG